LLLFVALSVYLELHYGWWRLLLVWFISGALMRLPAIVFMLPSLDVGHWSHPFLTALVLLL
jgi:hypothetical protein